MTEERGQMKEERGGGEERKVGEVEFHHLKVNNVSSLSGFDAE